MCKVSKFFSFWQNIAKKSWSQPKQLKNAAVRPDKPGRPNKRRVAPRTDSPRRRCFGVIRDLMCLVPQFPESIFCRYMYKKGALPGKHSFLCVSRFYVCVAAGYSPASKR